VEIKKRRFIFIFGFALIGKRYAGNIYFAAVDNINNPQ
jgi:hypothetical protein